MKLYKKAAACLLTAAMAISMLTACGRWRQRRQRWQRRQRRWQHSQPLPNNPDQIILPDIDEGEGGEGTGTKPTKTPIIDVDNSMLAKFTKKHAGATEFYVEMQEVDYGEDGSAARSIDGRAAPEG